MEPAPFVERRLPFSTVPLQDSRLGPLADALAGPGAELEVDAELLVEWGESLSEDAPALLRR